MRCAQTICVGSLCYSSRGPPLSCLRTGIMKTSRPLCMRATCSARRFRPRLANLSSRGVDVACGLRHGARLTSIQICLATPSAPVLHSGPRSLPHAVLHARRAHFYCLWMRLILSTWRSAGGSIAPASTPRRRSWNMRAHSTPPCTFSVMHRPMCFAQCSLSSRSELSLNEAMISLSCFFFNDNDKNEMLFPSADFSFEQHLFYWLA